MTWDSEEQSNNKTITVLYWCCWQTVSNRRLITLDARPWLSHATLPTIIEHALHCYFGRSSYLSQQAMLHICTPPVIQISHLSCVGIVPYDSIKQQAQHCVRVLCRAHFPTWHELSRVWPSCAAEAHTAHTFVSCCKLIRQSILAPFQTCSASTTSSSSKPETSSTW